MTLSDLSKCPECGSDDINLSNVSLAAGDVIATVLAHGDGVHCAIVPSDDRGNTDIIAAISFFCTICGQKWAIQCAQDTERPVAFSIEDED